MLELITIAGVDRPLVNHRIRTPERTYEVDFCWPDQKLIVEADGRAGHDSDPRFVSDRERDLSLAVAGWTVHRFAPDHIFGRPEQTISRIRALLQAAPTAR